MKRILFLTFLLFQIFMFAGVPAARAQETTPFVYVLTYDGAVTPAMVEYMQRGIRNAERDGAEAADLPVEHARGQHHLDE